MGFINNIDTFIYSIDIENYDVTAELALIKLEEKKLIAKESEEKKAGLFITYPTSINGYSVKVDKHFDVFPNGARMHAYIIENEHFKINIAQKRSTNKYNYPVQVRISSEALWLLGLNGAISDIHDLISHCFGKIITTKVTRADICIHTDMIPFKDMNLNMFKGRYRDDSLHRTDRKINTFYLGSKSSKTVFCRIYNKSFELEVKRNKTWFYDVWEHHGLDKDNVWNIEYEVKREFFKERNIETIDDFNAKLNDIYIYLMQKWLSINIKEYPMLDEVQALWLEISNARYNDEPLQGLTRSIISECSSEELIPQMQGLITSYAAKKGIFNTPSLMKDVFGITHSYCEQKKNMTLKQVIQKKMESYA